ncbi:unnamed protein product [Clonostachys byssicola]|uniref:Uncharacterized protein n=1 Tax=Clonostachys byssicola TaxID=160290 RepID=A0A9N9UCW6_9HYPO|nr:unnamed protein product [Clonostachys byssicola]
MLAMPPGIPAGMVADSPILRIPCIRATPQPHPEPVVRRQPPQMEYPQGGGLYDDPYGRSPHDPFFRQRNPVVSPSQHPVLPPRVNEHHHYMLPRVNEQPQMQHPQMQHPQMQHKIHKSYPRHQRSRSGSGSPPRNEPILAPYPSIHGSAQRPPRMPNVNTPNVNTPNVNTPNVNTPSNYLSVTSLQKPDFSLQAHESLLRQAAMRAALHNGVRQTKPVVERPVRHPLPTGRPGEKLPSVPRQTRRTLSDREKLDICLFHEHHRSLTHKDIADKFGVERTTVTKILLNKQHHLNSGQN